ncbi:PP2C family protein-serine/threonine phosphatase [Nonomuraea sp. KM88]
MGQPKPMADSPAGRAFLSADVVEVAQVRGVRMYLPLLDGSDQVGVMALTLDAVTDDDRRLLRRLAGLVADMLVTKNAYTDQFFLTRRREPMSVSAEIQWSLLPPLSMSVPQIEVAGILEPAYRVAGDSFDYALNDNILQVAVIDAMGHGLDAASMATIAIGAYRHARRVFISLAEKYAFMDDAISRQFGPDHFVTAQLMQVNITTGELELVNAGHPAPLLIRDGRVARTLESATTLPVGFGGEEPRIAVHMLQRDDRVLCYTDGIIEERVAGGEPFGEERLIRCVKRLGEEASEGVRADLRRLSHTLKQERSERTSDDATLFMIEWHGGAADHLAVVD